MKGVDGAFQAILVGIDVLTACLDGGVVRPGGVDAGRLRRGRLRSGRLWGGRVRRRFRGGRRIGCQERGRGTEQENADEDADRRPQPPALAAPAGTHESNLDRLLCALHPIRC